MESKGVTMTQSFLVSLTIEEYELPWFTAYLNQQWAMGVTQVTSSSSATMGCKAVERYRYRPDRQGG